MGKSLIAILVGFVVSLVFVPMVMKFVRKLKSEQQILEYVQNHMNKNGTLTLGGLIFIIGGVVSFFLMRGENSILARIALLVFVAFGLLGFLDDFIKIKLKRNLGLKAYQKIIGQVGISLIVALFIYRTGLVGSEFYLPFSNKSINLGFWIVPIVMIFFIAVTNAVNLIDGLDGLAGSVSFIFLLAFAIVIFIFAQGVGVTNVIFQEYESLMVLCGCVAGGVLAFLIVNWFPAKIFMGDTGSLALGGLIASVLSFTKQYLLVFIMGFLFVFTIFSSALQVFVYKLTKKRVFKIAPFHHNLELYGMKETRIVYLYSLITFMLCLLTIVLYLGV